MITLFLANWKYVVIGILILLLGVTFNLWRHEAEAFGRFKGEVQVVGEWAEKRNRQVEKEAKELNKQIGDDYAKSIDYIRKYYERRMHKYSSSSNMPSIPNAPSRIDEISSNALPLAGQCAETTKQLEELKKWVKEQEKIYNGNLR